MKTKDDIPEQEISLQGLINAICRRPNMYAANTNLSTIAAFIDGFAYGNQKKRLELRMFNIWLARRLKFSGNWAWSFGLEQAYPDTEEALRELPKLFEEFTRSL